MADTSELISKAELTFMVMLQKRLQPCSPIGNLRRQHRQQTFIQEVRCICFPVIEQTLFETCDSTD